MPSTEKSWAKERLVPNHSPSSLSTDRATAHRDSRLSAVKRWGFRVDGGRRSNGLSGFSLGKGKVKQCRERGGRGPFNSPPDHQARQGLPSGRLQTRIPVGIKSSSIPLWAGMSSALHPFKLPIATLPAPRPSALRRDQQPPTSASLTANKTRFSLLPLTIQGEKVNAPIRPI